MGHLKLYNLLCVGGVVGPTVYFFSFQDGQTLPHTTWDLNGVTHKEKSKKLKFPTGERMTSLIIISKQFLHLISIMFIKAPFCS